MEQNPHFGVLELIDCTMLLSMGGVEGFGLREGNRHTLGLRAE